ncbi:MAG: methyltransferase domain-containing protein [Pseudonocardiaceae bacterium]|nr:methyltransferase domain-containing protein [Pseudonocardiaceae bacterium]
MTGRPEELFRSAAPYYARYRPGYPPEFFSYLRDRLHLDGTQRVLDLGCGTGQISIPLANLVGEVIAVDPEPGMLDEARLRATELDTIDWRIGDSTALTTMGLGALDLTTMGASFHWMDCDAVLRDLDTITVPGGAVVVASGSAPGITTESPPWAGAIAEVRARWLGSQRRRGSDPAEGHAEALARSPFSRVETVGWAWSLERDLDALVGLQLSYSYSTPALLGDQRAAFEHDLREALLEMSPSGTFTEHIRTEALVGTRP